MHLVKLARRWLTKLYPSLFYQVPGLPAPPPPHTAADLSPPVFRLPRPQPVLDPAHIPAHPPLNQPFDLIRGELSTIERDIKALVYSQSRLDTAVLERAAAYYFDDRGKLFRPGLVILLSRALDVHCSGAPPRPNHLAPSNIRSLSDHLEARPGLPAPDRAASTADLALLDPSHASRTWGELFSAAAHNHSHIATSSSPDPSWGGIEWATGSSGPSDALNNGSAADLTSLETTITRAVLGAYSRAVAQHRLASPAPPGRILPAQHRTALITELIHTASLIHDDILDEASVRRGKPALHCDIGTKEAVLVGDFLLAQASMGLAAINHTLVVRHLAHTIADLVNGELIQLATQGLSRVSGLKAWATGGGQGLEPQLGQPLTWLSDTDRANPALNLYLRKSFFKTGSLLAHASCATALLGDAPPDLCADAFDLGAFLGLAFQLVDDILDWTASESQLGKPTRSDLVNGCLTAPVMFALHGDHAEDVALILVELARVPDSARAADIAHRLAAFIDHADGIARTYALARSHIALAQALLRPIRPSPYLDSLYVLTESILARTR